MWTWWTLWTLWTLVTLVTVSLSLCTMKSYQCFTWIAVINVSFGAGNCLHILSTTNLILQVNFFTESRFLIAANWIFRECHRALPPNSGSLQYKQYGNVPQITVDNYQLSGASTVEIEDHQDGDEEPTAHCWGPARCYLKNHCQVAA